MDMEKTRLPERDAHEEVPRLSALDKRLLNEYQHGFPLIQEPYAAIAGEMNISEDDVLKALERLKTLGIVNRIGPVFRPHTVGWSTLAAMHVPQERIEYIASIISSHPQVNHNYEREHELNLWFVVTALSEEEVNATLNEIAEQTGLEIIDLPMLESFHIDLGFALS
jgi:DNA-binding Lrp family transcriptional regulator